MNDPKSGLLSRLLGGGARRNFEARDQHDVHRLGIIGPVMPENVHFTPAAGQGDKIRMFHQQTATVGDVNEKGAEGLRVEQLPHVIRFHAFNNIVSPDSRKRSGAFDREALAGLTAKNAKITKKRLVLVRSWHCNSRNCSQAAKKFQKRHEPRNTRNTRNPEPARLSFRVFRVFRGYHFGCGFAALRSLRSLRLILCPLCSNQP